MSEAVLGSTTRLYIEDSVGAGTYTLVEQTENTDSSLTNDNDEITNADSSQKKEHKLTLQGLEAPGSLVKLPAASMAGSGQELLRNYARNMTEGIRARLAREDETETFYCTVDDLSTSNPTDAVTRWTFSITRTGDSVIS
jgi:hypothetical protein